jgi:alkylation response protein AidB-like acyl-CoA dehydrogenase
MSDLRVDELLAWLRDYASTRIDLRLQDERRCVQPHVVLDLGRKGVLGGLRVPAAYGGLELSPPDAMRVGEQLGAIDLTLAAWIGQNSWLGIQPIVDAGTPAQKQELLPDLAAGRTLASFALTERVAGSDPKGIETRLTDKGSGRYVLHGDKCWIGNASWAHVVTVFARFVDADGVSQSPVACLVRSGTRGYEIGPELLTMGQRASVQNRIRFDNVEISRADLLGDEIKGFSVMHGAMQGARMGIAAVAVGGMRRCLQLQYRYASRRRVSQGTLLDYPRVLLGLNESLAKTECIASMVAQVAALEVTAPGSIPDQVYMAMKVAGSELLWEVADGAVQALGARGYTESNIVSRILRDARVFRVFEGPTEALEHFIGALAGGRRLYEFLADELGDAELGNRLRSAVFEIRERSGRHRDRFGSRTSDLAHALAGRVSRWGIMLAFARRAYRTSPTAVMQMSRDWAALRFEQCVLEACSEAQVSQLSLGADAIEEILSSNPMLALETCEIGEVHRSDLP